MKNRITNLFGIEFPIIQAGMIWCSGWELASAVSNAGGLGIIGAGSMYPDVFEENLKKCIASTDKPFGVNLPLLYVQIEDHISLILKYKVPIVFTSAGNPSTYIKQFKDAGIKVVHVVSSVKFALKAEAAGCDAIVAEGFEAGGHNGREETTTLCLIPAVVDAVKIPVIAAGGIGSGKAMLAAFALGAEGVQVGTRFVTSKESSGHQNFKNAILNANEGDTKLLLKSLTPVRLLKNKFQEQVIEAELQGKSVAELTEILSKGRAKKGMFEGDLTEGELEIGQVSAYINEIKSAKEIVDELMADFFKEGKMLSELIN